MLNFLKITKCSKIIAIIIIQLSGRDVWVVVSKARSYSQDGRVWGIWAKTRGEKECFSYSRNRVNQSSMWPVPILMMQLSAI